MEIKLLLLVLVVVHSQAGSEKKKGDIILLHTAGSWMKGECLDTPAVAPHMLTAWEAEAGEARERGFSS